MPSRSRVTNPAACRACRCWEAFATDCLLAFASWSTVRGPWASRSSSSRRRGLAKALPITAIDSNSGCLSAIALGHVLIFNRTLDKLSSPMYFRQFLNDETACASYLFGCKTAGEFAVVDAHVDLVDDYVAAAESQGIEDRRRDRDARSGGSRLRTTRSSSSAPGRPPTCREGSGAEFDPPRARGWRAGEARQHGDRGDRHARTRTGASRLPGHRSPPR